MDADSIRLLQLQGELHDLEVKTESSGGNHLHFDVYRFSFGERRLVFYSLRGNRRVAPFLAAGDRVEVVAHWPGQAPREEGLVYALRNLEDGRVYLSHAIFRIRFPFHAMTAFTARRQREMGRILGGLALATMSLLAVVAVFAGPEPQWGLLLVCAVCFAVGLAVIALSAALVRTLWRRGWVTPRQHLTDRVYAALGVGPAVAARLPPRVYEV